MLNFPPRFEFERVLFIKGSKKYPKKARKMNLVSRFKKFERIRERFEESQTMEIIFMND